MEKSNEDSGLEKENNTSEVTETEKLLEQRRLHYDKLLWQVTSIFTAAIIGLLLFTHETEKPNIIVALTGLILTLFTLYLTTSFRLYRFGLETEFYRRHFRTKSLPQWSIYILALFGLEALWFLFLYEVWPSYASIWVVLFLMSSLITLILWFVGKNERAYHLLFND